MREIQSQDYWCPFARVSERRATRGGDAMEIVPGGGMNAALVYIRGASRPDARLLFGCQGRRCALWRWGMLSRMWFLPTPWRRGRCGAVPEHVSMLRWISVGAVCAGIFKFFI